MPLQGTFDVLDFTEILRLLGRRGVTGRLHLRSRSVTANLFLEEGDVVGADQSDHQPAAATGDVRSRLEEMCFELLEADRGSFEFQPGKATSLPGTARLKVEDVLARARVRLDEWRALTERIPSLDVHPQVVPDLNVAEVTLDRERWRMLTTIDGRRNLRAIGRALNLSDFEACRLLVDLLDAGVVDLDEAAKAAAGNRDLVPTIPLPESLAESAAHPGDEDIESVTVNRTQRSTVSATERARVSDDAKRATTKPAVLGASRAGPAGGDAEATVSTEPAPVSAEAAVEPEAEERPRSKRRARRRTPGGGSTPADEAPTPPAGEETAPVDGSAPSDLVAAGPAQEGEGPADEEPDARRARRVIRIRSRAEPRTR